ncbi:MAG: DOMON-like domain-containing protein [Thiothrix sp.]
MVERTEAGGLCLQYLLSGDLAQILFPAPQAPAFTNGLWEHTCFELFVGVQGESAYHEFNFSPSSQWAAYAFSGYREKVGGKSLPCPSFFTEGGLDPDSANCYGVESSFLSCTRRSEGDFILKTPIPVTDLPANPEHKPCELGLTAVIETTTGEKSYWALQHPLDRPDFHHRSGFVTGQTASNGYF